MHVPPLCTQPNQNYTLYLHHLNQRLLNLNPQILYFKFLLWDVLSATELVKVTNSPLVIKSGLKSREGYNGVSTVCIFKNLVRLSTNKMSNISGEIRVMQRVGVAVLCHLKKLG